MDTEYKEQSFNIMNLNITKGENIPEEINQLLNKIFRIDYRQKMNEQTTENMYMYLNPETQSFESETYQANKEARTKIKEQYLSLLETFFEDKSGSIRVDEEIFGVVTGPDRVRFELEENEYKFKFLNGIPINQVLQLCVLIVDEYAPRIVTIKPTFDN